MNKWLDLTDDDLADLRVNLVLGCRWDTEIKSELLERPARRRRSEALRKEFEDVAKAALENLKVKNKRKQ